MSTGFFVVRILIVNVPPTTAGRLPNLGAFVPPGSHYDSVVSAPVQGLGKALSGMIGECYIYAVWRHRLTGVWFAGVPQLPELNKASYLVFPWGTNDPAEAAQRKAAKLGEPSMYGHFPGSLS